jgi:hypothetical protein
MRNLLSAAGLTLGRQILLSMVAVVLVFATFALLKINDAGKQEPVEELVTGTIRGSSITDKSISNEPIVSFLAPASPQPSPPLSQRAAVVREPIPLPRPRPKRL